MNQDNGEKPSLSEDEIAELNGRLEQAERDPLNADPAARALTSALQRMRKEDVSVAPDVLPKVQQSLFIRSRGRFFRDRFSRTDSVEKTWGLLWVAAIGIVVVVVAWFYLAISNPGVP